MQVNDNAIDVHRKSRSQDFNSIELLCNIPIYSRYRKRYNLGHGTSREREHWWERDGITEQENKNENERDIKTGHE